MCVQEAVNNVRDECDMKAERERRVLQDKHAEEISELHDRQTHETALPLIPFPFLLTSLKCHHLCFSALCAFQRTSVFFFCHHHRCITYACPTFFISACAYASVCSRLRELRDSLEQVCRERVEYEAEFKVSLHNEVIINK